MHGGQYQKAEELNTPGYHERIPAIRRNIILFANVYGHGRGHLSKPDCNAHGLLISAYFLIASGSLTSL